MCLPLKGSIVVLIACEGIYKFHQNRFAVWWSRKSCFPGVHAKPLYTKCQAVGESDPPESNADSERSDMVNEEAVLFLFQLQLDQEMQKAMTYENYQDAMEIRSRREQVPEERALCFHTGISSSNHSGFSGMSFLYLWMSSTVCKVKLLDVLTLSYWTH